jgi:phage/plasmid primase-like uncharacterized protein
MAIQAPGKTQQNQQIRIAAAARWFAKRTAQADLECFAQELGVSRLSLVRLGVGWGNAALIRRLGTRCRRPGVWTFPMADAQGQVVGMRLRAPNGAKFSVRGGTEGLFLPAKLESADQILMPEGPTDTAALLDLGFSVVGRPSCHGGTDHLRSLVQRLQPTEVVVVADNDAVQEGARSPGQRGAKAIAESLLPYVPVIRLVSPPGQIKDARAWAKAGASHGDVHQAIQSATSYQLQINGAAT